MQDCAVCNECEIEYPIARKNLGYNSCLSCGEVKAKKIAALKARRTAPAFNKGAYMYITSKKMVRDLGR